MWIINYNLRIVILLLKIINLITFSVFCILFLHSCFILYMKTVIPSIIDIFMFSTYIYPTHEITAIKKNIKKTLLAFFK